MTKFVGKNIQLKLTDGGGTYAATQLQSVDTSEEVDTYMAEVAGDANKTTFTGLKSSTLTVNMLVDKTEITEQNKFAPGAEYTGVEFRPNGDVTGEMEIVSTRAVVIRRTFGASVTALTAMTAELNLDNFTLQAQA